MRGFLHHSLQLMNAPSVPAINRRHAEEENARKQGGQPAERPICRTHRLGQQFQVIFLSRKKFLHRQKSSPILFLRQIVRRQIHSICGKSTRHLPPCSCRQEAQGRKAESRMRESAMNFPHLFARQGRQNDLPLAHAPKIQRVRRLFTGIRQTREQVPTRGLAHLPLGQRRKLPAVGKDLFFRQTDGDAALLPAALGKGDLDDARRLLPKRFLRLCRRQGKMQRLLPALKFFRPCKTGETDSAIRQRDACCPALRLTQQRTHLSQHVSQSIASSSLPAHE